MSLDLENPDSISLCQDLMISTKGPISAMNILMIFLTVNIVICVSCHLKLTPGKKKLKGLMENVIRYKMIKE